MVEYKQIITFNKLFVSKILLAGPANGTFS